MNMTDKPEQPAFARRKMLPKPSARAAINWTHKHQRFTSVFVD
jgi:hypothetical protein